MAVAATGVTPGTTQPGGYQIPAEAFKALQLGLIDSLSYSGREENGGRHQEADRRKTRRGIEVGGQTTGGSDMRDALLVNAGVGALVAMLIASASAQSPANPRYGKWKLKSEAPAPQSNVMTYEPHNG